MVSWVRYRNLFTADCTDLTDFIRKPVPPALAPSGRFGDLVTTREYRNSFLVSWVRYRNLLELRSGGSQAPLAWRSCVSRHFPKNYS
jgi:hypothetical protein